MPKVSRISDIWTGICCCHPPAPCIAMSGPIVQGSPTHISGGLKVGRLTDMVIGYCGHPGKIVTSSSKNFSNGLGKARIGDQVTGCTIGKLVTGNPTHESG